MPRVIKSIKFDYKPGGEFWRILPDGKWKSTQLHFQIFRNLPPSAEVESEMRDEALIAHVVSMKTFFFGMFAIGPDRYDIIEIELKDKENDCDLLGCTIDRVFDVVIKTIYERIQEGERWSDGTEKIKLQLRSKIRMA